MMIRLFSFTLLLSLASATQADTLYRWIEADGSITFSPKKPASGIDYQVIGDNSAAKAEPVIAAPVSTKSVPARTQSDVDKRVVEASVSWMNSDRQGTQGSQASEPPFAAARPAAGQSDTRIQRRQVADVEVRSVASRNKRTRQCAELNMRVTSLEERMRARLSPEAMDRTVLSMARYQHSLESFCQ